MPDDLSLGQLVQSVRKRRGLTQTELAAASGVSASLIRKLEQGTITDTRLETARKLAVALRVPTSALLAAAPPASSDTDEWEAVRRALDGIPASEAGQPTLDGLAQAYWDAVPLVLDSRYAELRAVLPALLADADALVTGSANGTQTAARNLRSQIRQLTAYLLGQARQFTAAGDAIGLAAGDASDPLTAMAAADWQSWILIRQGRLADAQAVAERWADEAEPRVSRASAEEFAAWGRFQLRITSAAIRDNRPDDARDALRLARIAAAGTGRDIIPAFNPWQVFGPVTVSMFQAQNALIEERPDVALRLARKLPARGFPLPETWHRHRLDVASAYAAQRQPAEAAEVLADVYDQAPEWLAQQRYARDILAAIIGSRRALPPRIRELADAIALPY